MGKSSPPAQDFRGAAQEQSQSSRESLEAQNFANRPTVNTPFGQQTFNATPQFDPVTGQYYNTYEQNINLTPELQSSLDSQQRIQLGRSQTAEGLLGRVGEEYSRPIDFSGATGLDLRPNSSGDQVQGQISQEGLNSVDPSQRYYDKSEDAVYNQFARRAEPRFKEEASDLRSQLYSQGLKEGDQAYDREFRRLNETQGDARLQAQDQATIRSGEEAARMFGMDTANRSRQFGENQSSGAFANQAADQAFQESLQRGGYQNQVRQQQIAEEMQRRGYSLNELNGLLGGQQVQGPQFPGFNASGRGSEANFLGAAQAQGQNNLDIFNTQSANQQSLYTGLASLALAFSDRRLKTDIEYLGEMKGRKFYRFRYIWHPDNHFTIGVMADENLDIAVQIGRNGYMMVDYSKL